MIKYHIILQWIFMFRLHWHSQHRSNILHLLVREHITLFRARYQLIEEEPMLINGAQLLHPWLKRHLSIHHSPYIVSPLPFLINDLLLGLHARLVILPSNQKHTIVSCYVLEHSKIVVILPRKGRRQIHCFFDHLTQYWQALLDL